MLTKEKIIEAISEMPDGLVNLRELWDKLHLLNAIQKAEDDIAAGRTYTQEQMKEIVTSWRQSSGQIVPKAI